MFLPFVMARGIILRSNLPPDEIPIPRLRTLTIIENHHSLMKNIISPLLLPLDPLFPVLPGIVVLIIQITL